MSSSKDITRGTLSMEKNYERAMTLLNNSLLLLNTISEAVKKIIANVEVGADIVDVTEAVVCIDKLIDDFKAGITRLSVSQSSN